MIPPYQIQIFIFSLSLSLSLLSLEASINTHYSSPFHRRPTRKSLQAPDIEQAKLPVKLHLDLQPPMKRGGVGKDRQSSHLQHGSSAITRWPFVLSGQLGHFEKALSILFPMVPILLGGSCWKISRYMCNLKF